MGQCRPPHRKPFGIPCYQVGGRKLRHEQVDYNPGRYKRVYLERMYRRGSRVPVWSHNLGHLIYQSPVWSVIWYWVNVQS